MTTAPEPDYTARLLTLGEDLDRLAFVVAFRAHFRRGTPYVVELLDLAALARDLARETEKAPPTRATSC
jgi:hypothetical protein